MREVRNERVREFYMGKRSVDQDEVELRRVRNIGRRNYGGLTV
jgi:hypothetical protein